MGSVLDYIENQGTNLDGTQFYAAILGESPSKGAKSPSLWNAAFSDLHISGLMHPMDVHPGNLGKLVEKLREDKRFIGAAVAVPYKVDIIPLLDSLEAEAKAIGAVNCMYLHEGQLVGANTDGAGAIWSIEREFGELSGKNVFLIGAGGAALAVAAYVASALGKSGLLTLANRNRAKAQEIANRLQKVCEIKLVDWPPSPDIAKGVNLLINCTSIGFETVQTDARGAYCLGFYTPLAATGDNIRVSVKGRGSNKLYAAEAAPEISENIVRSIKFLSRMNRPMIFDVIYQPRQTMLLSLSALMGYRTLNGVGMNLEQAVIAFDKATSAAGLRKSDVSPVRATMAKVW